MSSGAVRLVACAMLVAGCGAEQHEAQPALSLSVGAQQSLLEANAPGLGYFPDMGLSLLSPPPALRLVSAAASTSYLVEGSNFTQLTRATAVLAPGAAGEFDNGYAGISAVVKIGQRLYGYYHAEDWENLPSTGSWHAYYASIGLTISEDDGRTWVKQGQVLTSHAPKEWEAYPNQADRGAAEPGAVLTRDGKAVLLFYTEHSRSEGRSVDICVARAEIRDGVPGPFLKYRAGAFSEPGMAGLDSPVVTANAFPESNALEGHVTWSEAAQRYAMVFGVDAWGERQAGQPANNSGMYLAWSADGLDWSAPQQLIRDFAVPSDPSQPSATASLSWEGSLIWDPERSEQAWLLYGYSADFASSPTHLAGRRVALQR